jgi:spore maturation protein A
MINWIWLGLLAVGVLFGLATGRVDAITAGALCAAQRGVELALGLVGVMALWMGICQLAEEAGLVQGLSRLVRPILGKLFPNIPRNGPALGAIAMNLSANLLGLGNAATPLGIQAMKQLAKLNPAQDRASDEMCTFLLLNNSAPTLLPMTVLAIRAAAGSKQPGQIIGPAFLATCTAALAALLFDSILRWSRGD